MVWVIVLLNTMKQFIKKIFLILEISIFWILIPLMLISLFFNQEEQLLFCILFCLEVGYITNSKRI